MSFNAENYRKVRASILAGPFDWDRYSQARPTDPGCIACHCLRVDGAEGSVNGSSRSIERVLGCTSEEASNLWFPQTLVFSDSAAAVTALDLLAARYGVTTEPPQEVPAPPADDWDARAAAFRGQAQSRRPRGGDGMNQTTTAQDTATVIDKAIAEIDRLRMENAILHAENQRLRSVAADVEGDAVSILASLTRCAFGDSLTRPINFEFKE